MLKGLLGSLAIAALLASTPVSAQTAMECNEATMAKMESDMGKMPDGEKKAMAMKEMGIAKDMMAKKDMAGCKSSMEKAMGMAK